MTHRLRIRHCEYCGRLRTFNRLDVKRGQWWYPTLECRTCARRQRDPQRGRFVRMIQRSLFPEEEQ